MVRKISNRGKIKPGDKLGDNFQRGRNIPKKLQP